MAQMSGLFRSASMSYATIIFHQEIARETLRQLGLWQRFHIESVVSSSSLSSLSSSGSAVASQQLSEEEFEHRRRILDCSTAEKRLLSLLPLFKRYGIPINDIVSSINFRREDDALNGVAENANISSLPSFSHGDVLSSCIYWLDTVEKRINTNDNFLQQQMHELVELQEKCVLIKQLQTLRDSGDITVTTEEQDEKLGAGSSPNTFTQNLTHRRSTRNEEKLSLISISGGGGSAAPGLTVSASMLHQQVVGLIPSRSVASFERMVFRLSRGNALTKVFSLDGAYVIDVAGYSVVDFLSARMSDDNDSFHTFGERFKLFVVVFLGRTLRDRIFKVCESFGGKYYAEQYNSLSSARLAKLEDEMCKRIRESSTVLKRTSEDISEILHGMVEFAMSNDDRKYEFTSQIAGGNGGNGGTSAAGRNETSSADNDEKKVLGGFGNRLSTQSNIRCPWYEWLCTVREEKCIVDGLRSCVVHANDSKMLRLDGWVLEEEIDQLKELLGRCGNAGLRPYVQLSGSSPKKSLRPPTYFPVDKFTSSFQAIVDTYGVPRYKEVNPGLFTIISFPFLFGVMYGDIFHGSALTLFAGFLIWKEKDMSRKAKAGKLHEITSMVFAGRYLLFLMGLFAVYAGLIYNDALSLPLEIFNTPWAFPAATHNDTTVIAEFLGGSYPFGISYSWYHTTNQLAFFNSFKMKSSVIIGVCHMTLGLFLSLSNHIYFGRKLSIYFDFLPRIIFLLCTFGYMSLIIVIKWCTDWRATSAQPPNLVQTMISMFISPGSVDSDKQLFAGQAAIQVLLLLTAVFSVPVMLFGETVYFKLKSRWTTGIGFMSVPEASHSSRRPEESQLELRSGMPMSDLKSSLLANEHSADVDDVHVKPLDVQNHSHTVRSPSRASHVEESKGQAKNHLAINVDEHERMDERLATSPTSDSAMLTDDADSSAMDVDLTHPESPIAAGAVHDDAEHSDDLIHRSIHTIEFVLGTISNTASYLRLWALSLAHAQLAEVFWSKMMMQYGMSTGNPLNVTIGFAVWAGATFAVLLCMDVLECFLHALRLHWVEFQNKFYYGDGRPFQPFEISKTHYIK